MSDPDATALMDQFFADCKAFLQRIYGNLDGHKLWMSGQLILDLPKRVEFYSKLIEDVEAQIAGERMRALANLTTFHTQPVDLMTYVTDPYFMNKAQVVYPEVLRELTEMCSGKYTEIVCTGGIGSAKSTCAIYGTEYQLYRLSCMANPHLSFGLDPSSEILTIFQSIAKGVAEVTFKRLVDSIHQNKYFRERFPWDKDLSSTLVFPHRIEVKPVSGAETAAIGQNVIAGLIDELNYMTIVTKSKKSVDAGQYDQAVALYNSIARRRESRFGRAGQQLPGLLFLVSSKRYPGQFTDQKEIERDKQIARDGHSTIYIYDKRVWDVKPEGSFPEERFFVFAGDMTRQPRLLAEGEEVADEDRHLVVGIPDTQHYRTAFETDIINALREIAGMSTLARHPFIMNVELLSKAIGTHESIFASEWCNFDTIKCKFLPKKFYKPELPRWVHVDLAISGDSAGFSIGTVTSFTGLADGQGGMKVGEMMPNIRIDGSMEVRPPKGGEILFHKIREVIMALRKSGLNVRWVTYDSFQSRDSLQILKQQGFIVGDLSVDKTPIPYDFLKSAIYTERFSMPEHAKARMELVSLEKDEKTGKIDHPAQGSKDVSDSLAGVVHGLTNRREVWGLFRVPFVRIPDSINFNKAAAASEEEENVV